MVSRRGRRISRATVWLGLGLAAAAAFASRDGFIERYWLWRLGRADDAGRRAAVRKLGERGSRRAVPQLVGLLARRGEDHEIRQQAAEALVEIGAPAAAALCRLLDHPVTDVRRRAAACLAELGPGPSSSPALLAALVRAGEQPALRRLAAASLVRLGAPALPLLLEVHENGGRDVRRAVVGALRELPPGCRAQALPALIAALDDPDWTLRRAAAETLGNFGADARAALPALIGRLEDERPGGSQRLLAGAIERIGLSGDMVPLFVDRAMRTIRRKDPDPCWFRLLGHLGAEAASAVPILAAVIEDDCPVDGSLLHEAVDTLGRIGPAARSAVLPLIDLLVEMQGHPDFVETIELSLARIGPAALSALVATLDSGKAASRTAICLAFCAFGPAAGDAVPALTSALADEDPNVARAAVEALGYVGAAAGAAVPEILAAARDSDDPVAPVIACGRIGPAARPAADWILEVVRHSRDARARAHGLLALGRIGAGSPAVVQALKKAFEDDDELVRSFAAQALATLGLDEPTGKRVLEDALGDPEDRFHAREYLYALRGFPAETGRILPALLELLETEEDPRLRVLVIQLIAEAGPRARPASGVVAQLANGARPAIGAALDEAPLRAPFTNETVRAAAAAALRRINGAPAPRGPQPLWGTVR